MTRGRLEAFSDGVMAIIITIMVLEIKAPHGDSFSDLKAIVPHFVSYVLSFIYVGIYWNNHHHMLHAVEKINGKILWANLHLLFWLSLIPFTTAWMGENNFTHAPMAAYGFILFMSAIAYNILQNRIVSESGADSAFSKQIGKDAKGKISIIMYALGVGISFINEWVAAGLYILVAIMWLIPDKRVERAIED